MLRERSFAHRYGIACRMGDQSLGWEELHRRAAALAGLLAAGHGPVLLYGKKSPEYVIAIAGCLWAGRPYIPAGPHIPAARVAAMARLAGAVTAVFLTPPPDELRDMACVPLPRQGEGVYALPAVEPKDIAYILFTSGSTGTPKGVMVSYANLENFIKWFSGRPAIAGIYCRAVLNQAQFSFDLSVADLYYTLYTGCTLELPPDGVPLCCCGSRAELAVMTPSCADQCLMDEGFAAKQLPCLQTIFFCGETLRGSTVRRLWRRFPGLRVINAYGPTEATCAVTSAEITPELAEAENLPIGLHSQEAVAVYLDRNDCICLQGPSVAAGYLDGERFDGKFMTGDLGEFRAGCLWYRGRCDEQIKYKGYRIEPGEIEAILVSQKGIRQAVVLPRRDHLGRVISLQVLVTATGPLQEGALREQLRFILPDYMVPRRIVQCEKLPLTANGKIDRRKAGELLQCK